MMKLYPSLIDRLKTQYQTIENILISIDTRRVTVRPQPNKWNIHDNIAHLVQYQTVFIGRINQILLKNDPSFERYKAEDDPGFENARALDTGALITQLPVDRKAIYDILTGLTDTQLNKTGIHKKFGSLNIVQWTEFFLLHEAHHIFTIFQLAHDTQL